MTQKSKNSKNLLTNTQYELLSLIDDYSTNYSYWTADQRCDYCRSLGKDVIVSGGGVVSSLKSLERKGFIKRPEGVNTLIQYAYRITEEGKKALREMNGNRDE